MGFGLEFDSTCTESTPGTLVGGIPSRLLRLSPRGCEALLELRDGTVRSAAGAALARRLFDAGLAHPIPPRAELELSVIVPAHDRADLLAACLRSLGTRFPVFVVDDASHDPDAVAKVTAGHGAHLIRRDVNGGPAAARNTGLARVETDLVAFVDSDAIPTAEDLARIAAHLADPAVAAAAPRIRPTPRCVRRNGTHRPLDVGRKALTGGPCALDLGARAAQVAPFTRVSYVPATVLVVRRDVVEGFDETMRYGEDVDLIWRLHAAGHRVRYDPSVRVGHHEPTTSRALLERRYRYGTSAAPLSRRHPGTFMPLVLEPFTAAAVAVFLAGRPRLAAVVLTAALVDETLMRRQIGLSAGGAPRAVAVRVARTWRSSGAYATTAAAPALLAAAFGRPRFAAWALADPIAAWAIERRVNPAAHLAENVAYGIGVLAGCASQRTTAPLRPLIRRRRITR